MVRIGSMIMKRSWSLMQQVAKVHLQFKEHGQIMLKGHSSRQHRQLL